MSDLETKTKKRSTSIITVFLWLLLIAIMSTILIGSIFQENKLEYDRTITIKVDFTELIESGSIPEEYIDDWLASFRSSIYVTNDHIYTGEYGFRDIGREGNIVTYEIDFNNSEVNYIEMGLGNMPYNILEDETVLETYMDEYGDPYYIREITEEQDLYEFRLQKMDFDTTIELKVDFSNFLNDESIPEDYMDMWINFLVSETVYFAKDSNSFAKYDTRFLGLEGNIASYEVDFNATEANYMVIYPVYSDYTAAGYRVFENGELLECILGDGYEYYVRPITPNQKVYEFELQKNLYTYICVNVPDDQFPIEVWKKEGDKEAVKIDINWDQTSIEKVFLATILPDIDYTFYFISDTEEIWQIYEGDTSLDFDESMNAYVKKVNGSDIQRQYNFDLKLSGIIYSSIKWNNIEKKEALLEFGVSDTIYNKDNLANTVVFTEKLADGFTVSPEYENDPNWLIVNEDEIINDDFKSDIFIIKLDLDNNEYIPRCVYANFYHQGNNYITWNGKYEYIYIKDKNILYTMFGDEKYQKSVKLQYNNDVENKDLDVNLETKAIRFSISQYSVVQDYTGYTLEGKELSIQTNTTANIDVNKLVEGETGNVTYYIGLFENEVDSKTNKIYTIDTVDGIGSTTITIESYDGTTPYYIYEVDGAGNKISSDSIDYSKNKVLENVEAQEEKKIDTDKSIVSMVGTGSSDIIGTGLGSRYYVDNTIATSYEYKDTVTITGKYEEKVHVVKLEAGEGGRIEGETNIVVKDGETIDTIVNAIANDHYNFDKWVVIENGVEKEVDPSSYVITEDTTFIAKFKKDSYTVKYESSEGGRLEEKLEEIVEYGNSPVLVPSVISDENYEFDKWIVVENGVEIEVNLSNYEVEKDVTFIAKYKKINTIETSDIEVWKYVGIGTISIFVIAIIVVLIIIKKKNKNK